MQTPNQVLNIGADVAKGEIVVAGSKGSFPARKLVHQRTALLAFLKGLPAGSRIGMESTPAPTTSLLTPPTSSASSSLCSIPRTSN
jgi:hypothetical protein